MELADVRFAIAGDEVFLTVEDAQALLQNQAELLRWMREARNLLNFYRARDAPE